MVLPVAEQVFQAVKMVAGIIQVAARQRALHQQSQTLELLLRLEARKDIQTLAGAAFCFIQTRPCPQQLSANTQQELVHRQLFQMLFTDQLERFLLVFPGGLQESLSK